MSEHGAECERTYEEGYESLTRYPDGSEALLTRGAKPLQHLKGAISRQVAGVG
jgi:hypothetical protein